MPKKTKPNAAAVHLGKLRAASMTKAQRKALATHAINSRWAAKRAALAARANLSS
jgi:hypothetical protein